MKRVNYYIAVMLLSCLPLLLSAQLPKGVSLPPGDGGNTSLKNYTIEDCDLTYRFTVIVQHLDILNGLDYSQWGYKVRPPLSLPANYPPMYLRCELNGIVELVEANSFEYHSTYGFIFNHYMTIDITEYCEGQPASTVDTLNLKMTLLASDQLLVYYPICNYTSSGDLFDCAYLPPATTCPIVSCSNSHWASWSDNDTFRCGLDCGEPDQNRRPIVTIPTIGRNATDHDQRTTTPKETTLALEVHPNPFQSALNIHWKSDAETTTIRLFHSNGQLVKSWINLPHHTGDVLKINTDDLPNGIYFLRIQSGEKTVYKKLVKA